jgi:hypothetical protein
MIKSTVKSVLARTAAAVALTAASMFVVVSESTLPAPAAAADPALLAQPGDEISVDGANSKEFVCTLGFLVMTSDPTPAFLTAGHCVPAPGKPVYWNPDGTSSKVTLGYSRVVQYDGDTVGSTDIGLVDVSGGDGDLSKTAVLPGNVQMSGVSSMDELRRYNPTLCKQGYRSGRTCGRILRFIPPDKLTMETRSDHGDSGSPVYAVWPNGTYTAVGVLNGSPVSDESIAIIQLIQPWMGSWALRLAR